MKFYKNLSIKVVIFTIIAIFSSMDFNVLRNFAEFFKKIPEAVWASSFSSYGLYVLVCYDSCFEGFSKYVVMNSLITSA
jgi:hypothetical protein